MSHRIERSLAAFGVAMLLAACSTNRAGVSSTGTTADGQPHTGWYMQHAGQGLFQPCGAQRPWRITQAADLPKRARAFGLDEDTPVYVRVIGLEHDGTLAVMRVVQFGSPTPVRDCALTGVVLPPP
ncbi:hypothetical protein [Vulcaniibacterium gelatinicum]|uniref:hypothetical protein n=1 Tax=Vulcaniibacterium gelatinicum TaxID=2598725 RepID=UPI0011CA2833|nr:hypothetical protein [Vulcaniibacterium gelatinicum]